jgi:hypothetical protein
MNKKFNKDLYLKVFGWILSENNKKYSSPIKKAYLMGLFFFLLPAFGRQKAGNVWVVGSKIFSANSGFQRSTLISTPKDLKKIKRYPTFFAQFYRVYSLIYLSLFFEKPYLIFRAFKIINDSIVKYSPKLVIINSTKDPFNRLIAIAAKNNNIKTVCIQHGLFSPTIPDEVNEDDILDLYFAINKNQKSIISRKINNDKIKIISNSLFNTSQLGIEVKKICFVGEDWERYGDGEKKQIIIDFYLKLMNFLKSKKLSDLEFYYRPHPSEQNFFGIDKVIPIGLADADQYELFIGFSSTFLWDMAANNKPCLQIYTNLITHIDFEVEEICASIKLDDFVFNRVLEYIKQPQIKYIISRNNLFEMINLYAD